MQTPTPPPSANITSKRKRLTTDSVSHLSPSPTRLKTTDLPSQPLSYLDGDGTIASGSPRATITGHLQELDIQEQDGAVSKLDFGMGKRKNDAGTSAFAPRVRLPKNQTYNDTNSSNSSNSSSSSSYSGPVTPPTSSHGLEHPAPLHPQRQSPITLESPPTTAATSTTTAPNIPTPDPRLGNKSPVHSSNHHHPSPSTTNNNHHFSSSLWWTDTEITGHSPSDPTDDGYGINGVGFVPTPAMATARAEKRRRQVREWKEREAREARARRGLMRRQRLRDRGGDGVNDDRGGGVGDAKTVGSEGSISGRREEGMVGERERKAGEGGRKEVRFSDVMDVEVG